MNTIKSNIQQLALVILQSAVSKIETNFPSVYSKDDVKVVLAKVNQDIQEMIEKLELPEQTTAIYKDKLVNELVDALCNSPKDYIEVEGEAFRINYRNEVELDEWNVEVRTNDLRPIITDAINQHLNNEE